MKNRVDIKDFILQIERDFPVNNWKVEGIHLWPMLRIRLFFHLIRKLEATSDEPKKEKLTAHSSGIANKLGRLFGRFLSIVEYFRWKNSLKKKDYVFVGFDVHRAAHDGERYNKFFDPIIDRKKIADESMVFEFGPRVAENQHNKKLIVWYQKAMTGFWTLLKFRKAEPNIELEAYRQYHKFLADNPYTKEFSSWASYEITRSSAVEFYKRVLFFESVLRKIQPCQAMFVCYYSNSDEMAMITAANRLGIKTVEMQHGPQTDIHLCYGNWNRAPEGGYDMLPREFWCWDEHSKNVMMMWAGKGNPHHAFVGGNPWIDFWKENAKSYESKDFVLYSLQPWPLTIGELFPPSILEVIKKSERKWFLRLHPRQKDLQQINDLFVQNDILDKVEIESATNAPLPLLLANAALHVTHYSGTAIEASLFNLFTVLLNEKALASFPGLISEGKAAYLDPRDSQFMEQFEALSHSKR